MKGSIKINLSHSRANNRSSNVKHQLTLENKNIYYEEIIINDNSTLTHNDNSTLTNNQHKNPSKQHIMSCVSYFRSDWCSIFTVPCRTFSAWIIISLSIRKYMQDRQL